MAFCQNQFTFDARLIEPQAWRPGAWCDIKGRCLIVILAKGDEDRVELVIPTSQSQLVDRLRMFSIGHKVQFGPFIGARGSFSEFEGASIMPGPEKRFLALDNDQAPDQPGLVQRWRRADIKTPITWLQPASSGQHLPQFLGLEDNGGLSFTKGCFPGQEVVARVHYLGKVKRHLLGFTLDNHAIQPPAPGARLIDQAGNEGGAVVDSMATADGAIIGLAVCPVAVQPGSTLQTASETQAQILKMALPTSL